MKTLEDITEFHGHMCPGLAFGYRVSIKALQELGGRSADEEIVAIVENNSCAVDAVQFVTGCTFGKGNLIFLDYGKQVYTFYERKSGEGIRIAVNMVQSQETPDEKDAWDRYRQGERSEEISKVVHERKSRKIEAILDAPDEDLFSISKPQVELPPEARIYTSLACAMCGEKVMEPRVRLVDGEPRCLPCSDK